ncbi:MAG: CBS domain-containing protein [Spirochaetia bacterium]
MSEFILDTVESPPFVQDLIYRLKLKDVMTPNPVTVSPQTSMSEIQSIMRAEGISGIPVVEGKRILGIISMDDIIQSLEKRKTDSSASENMSKNLIVLEDDMPLFFGITYFRRYKYGRFPVLNKHKELVGIITGRDVLISLIREMNKEIEKLETGKQDKEYPAEPGKIFKRFSILKFDFQQAGKASTEIRKILKNLGVHSKIIRRTSVAAYELEMNITVHSLGGTITFVVENDEISITAADRGPGIPDVELALQEGYTTANEWIRSLGFGAGMGLPNVKRVSDEFSITAGTGGTTVISKIKITRPGDTSV